MNIDRASLSYGRSPGTECTGSRESRIAAEAALVTAIGQDATKPHIYSKMGMGRRDSSKVLRSYMPSALFGIAPGDQVVGGGTSTLRHSGAARQLRMHDNGFQRVLMHRLHQAVEIQARIGSPTERVLPDRTQLAHFERAGRLKKMSYQM